MLYGPGKIQQIVVVSELACRMQDEIAFITDLMAVFALLHELHNSFSELGVKQCRLTACLNK